MKKNTFVLTIFAAIASILVGGYLWSSQVVPAFAANNAQETNSAAPQRYITVVGEGIVRIKPDIARTTIGVETIKPTVKEASSENQATITSVLDALAETGIAENDIQTAGFNIYTEQNFDPDAGQQSEPTYRYHVTNQVQVTIRDTDQVGDVLDVAIEAGANSTYGVEFRLDDQDAARTEARALAIANALEKANELAALNGVTVGEVLSVSEVIGSSPFYSAASDQAFGLGGGGGTPISAGELQLTVQIQVSYAIE